MALVIGHRFRCRYIAALAQVTVNESSNLISPMTIGTSEASLHVPSDAYQQQPNRIKKREKKKSNVFQQLASEKSKRKMLI